jgi:hypothetical protein
MDVIAGGTLARRSELMLVLVLMCVDARVWVWVWARGDAAAVAKLVRRAPFVALCFFEHGRRELQVCGFSLVRDDALGDDQLRARQARGDVMRRFQFCKIAVQNRAAILHI